MTPPAQSNRILFIDNLRVVCIILVVMQHAAVTYSGLGSWYYTESNEPLRPGSLLFFGLFQSHLQAFFMSMFFLLAGYFVPDALQRKGPKRFALDRLKRLGLPLLVYIFLLHPLTVKLIWPDVRLGAYWLSGLLKLECLGWTGPLWFVETLLILSLACLPFARHLKVQASDGGLPLSAGFLWALIGAVTAGAFGLRLVFPIGTSFSNQQFCFFSAYLAAFSVGVLAGRNRGFERITPRAARRWLLAAFGIGLPLWSFTMVFSGANHGGKAIDGGLNIGALAYAFWESFFCVAIITALLGLAREKANFQKPWMRFLADHTFAVYVFHAVVLVAISLALRPLALPPVAKFAVVSLLAVSASFGCAWLIRLVSPLRAWFA